MTLCVNTLYYLQYTSPILSHFVWHTVCRLDHKKSTVYTLKRDVAILKCLSEPYQSQIGARSGPDLSGSAFCCVVWSGGNEPWLLLGEINGCSVCYVS